MYAGRVTVDGMKAELGARVEEGQRVCVDGKPVEKRKVPVLLAVNKPKGIVCTCANSKVEKDNIVDFLSYPERIYPVGRLDKDSEGLILMTNQGDLVNKILRGGNEHEKEYIVKVDRPVTPEFLEKMRGGVPILDTVTKPCRAEKLEKNKFRIVLTQGLNRQIRRMCEALGYRVTYLKRVRVMNIRLGNLKAGEYREIKGAELEAFLKLLEHSSNASYKERMEEEKTRN